MPITTRCTCSMSLTGFCAMDIRECKEPFLTEMDNHYNYEDMEEKRNLDQLLYDLIECVHDDKLVLSATPGGKSYDPDPEIDRLRKKILSMYGQPSAAWVKASERLPGMRAEVKWRIDGEEWEMKETPLGMWYNKPNDFHKYEWLDESGTAAAGREEDDLTLLSWLNKNEWSGVGNGEYINHSTGRIIKQEKLYQEFKQQKEK